MTNEKRLIYANALKANFVVLGEFAKDLWHTSTIRMAIDNAPTVDAVEVVHSEWILNDDGSGTCKHCHRTTKAVWDFDNAMNYCPNCGAKMDL